jgi:tRNA G26 N,N-dimethylase Trm1
MNLPGIDDPKGARCEECGEPLAMVDPVYCGACEDRLDEERRRESGNEYRKLAQIALELESVRKRTREHLEAKR